MRLLAITLILLGLQGQALAQADFVEAFDAVGPTLDGTDGPVNLIAQGWSFSNQSDPIGWTAYHDGLFLEPYEGASYLEVDSLATGYHTGGDVSVWAVLPQVPGQTAGDTFSVFLQRLGEQNADRVELRYSPTAGVDTGTTATSVGDFTVLLAERNFTDAGGWLALDAPVPGSGRLAIRYAVDSACGTWLCGSTVIGLDYLTVGPPPTPNCNQPPLPNVGETVRWTAAGGPWEICADLAIPEGGVVIVDPGATVLFDPGKTLTVSGELRVEGSAGQPVVLDLDPTTGSSIHVPGWAELEHAEIHGRLQAAPGGTLLVRGCLFQGGGSDFFTSGGVGSDQLLIEPEGAYVDVEDCQFVQASIYLLDATLDLRSSSFQDGVVSLQRSYLRLHDVTVDGGSVAVHRERYTQPLWFSELSVQGSPTQALDLAGYQFLVDGSTSLVANHGPLALRGGLLPGSVLPATGNSRNWIDVGGTLEQDLVTGSVVWSDPGIPYVVDKLAEEASSLLLLEGVDVRFTPGSGVLFYGGGTLRARGTQAAPVRFSATQPTPGWFGLKFQSSGGDHRFEHAAIDDAQFGVLSDNSVVHVESSTLSGNDAGVWTSTFGLARVRGTAFLGNGVGAHVESGQIDLSGATNGNSLVGNGVGVEFGTTKASDNYWGHPSGPDHPSNPGGAGDSATSGVVVLPFRASAPDPLDAPPRVTLQSVGPFQDSGSKLWLQWDCHDDSGIHELQVWFSVAGNIDYQLLATLPRWARSHEFDVPVLPAGSVQLGLPHLRVVAVDDAGQEGWDELSFMVPYVEDVPVGSLRFTTDLSVPRTFGDRFDVEWDSPLDGLGTVEVYVVSDQDGSYQYIIPGVNGLATVRMPFVSTDRARLLVRYHLGAGGRSREFYSQSFAIRPNDLIDDAPPSVSVHAPSPGAVVSGGSLVPVRWTADDDEFVREFRVLASYDGGRGWNSLARMPGDAREFLWKTPPSTGVEVLLRVVAVDARFQNTSDEVALTVEAASGGPGWKRK